MEKWNHAKQGKAIVFGREKTSKEHAMDEQRELRGKGKPTKLVDVIERLEKIEEILGAMAE